MCSTGSRFGSRMRSRASTESYTTSRRSEEHTSELQSQSNLVCRLLLEKKNISNNNDIQLSIIMRFYQYTISTKYTLQMFYFLYHLPYLSDISIQLLSYLNQILLSYFF